MHHYPQSLDRQRQTKTISCRLPAKRSSHVETACTRLRRVSSNTQFLSRGPGQGLRTISCSQLTRLRPNQKPTGEHQPLIIMKLVPISKANCEFTGPYQCPYCQGHLMVDASFVKQVAPKIVCPYCQLAVKVPKDAAAFSFD